MKVCAPSLPDGDDLRFGAIKVTEKQVVLALWGALPISSKTGAVPALISPLQGPKTLSRSARRPGSISAPDWLEFRILRAFVLRPEYSTISQMLMSGAYIRTLARRLWAAASATLSCDGDRRKLDLMVSGRKDPRRKHESCLPAVRISDHCWANAPPSDNPYFSSRPLSGVGEARR